MRERHQHNTNDTVNLGCSFLHNFCLLFPFVGILSRVLTPMLVHLQFPRPFSCLSTLALSRISPMTAALTTLSSCHTRAERLTATKDTPQTQEVYHLSVRKRLFCTFAETITTIIYSTLSSPPSFPASQRRPHALLHADAALLTVSCIRRCSCPPPTADPALAPPPGGGSYTWQ